jgi:hypothetical protein
VPPKQRLCVGTVYIVLLVLLLIGMDATLVASTA